MRPLSAVWTVFAATDRSGFAPNLSDSTSVLNPASPSAEAIHGLFLLVLAIAAVIFVLVVGTLLYFVIRYRRRENDEGGEPAQIYGSDRLEWAWTIAPTLIVFVLFLVVVRIVVAMREMPVSGEDQVIRVVAHQWWWDFGYPDSGFDTANEMHVPISTSEQRRTIVLKLESADVVHSFWVPRLGGKTDVIPGRVNHMHFEVDQPGVYRGQCAEYCGMGHARMLIRVVAQTPEDFEAWVEHQKQPAVEAPEASSGRQAFMEHTCRNCHTIRGTAAHGVVGPDLTHLMSRQTLAAGVLPNDREDLEAWVRDPQAIKPGCKMPALGLEAKMLSDIVEYLATLQ